ncbi:putative cytochrome p450 [Rosellinia necatrix]|uniref:Putative cytochrome p450 n=1 Tax=Rosellinia necatrix TaxID=77044 RepID=A0A1W2TQP2_ROSNE|nr:putative cytochrome p450 [Rosellinia necatrix]
MPNAPDFDEILGHLGPETLLSQSNVVTGWQYNLAANQWQKDMSHLWDIMMAGRQAAVLDAAYGPTDSEVRVNWVEYSASDFKTLCNTQKMRTTLYASFSLFGLISIFLVGILLSVASYVLESLSCVLHTRGYGQYEDLEWKINSTMQLQRSAYEAFGIGTWSNCTRTIPITKEDEVLGSLDILDPEHPLIC